jgi:hypothetical protein
MKLRRLPCTLLLLGILGFGCPSPPTVPSTSADADVAPEPADIAPEPEAAPVPVDPDEPPLAVQPELLACRAEATVNACTGGRRAMACEVLVVRAVGREPTREGAEASALEGCGEAVTQQRAREDVNVEVESDCAILTCVNAHELDLCRRLVRRACRACGDGSEACRSLRPLERDGDVDACRPRIEMWEREVGPLAQPDPTFGVDAGAVPCERLVLPPSPR